MKLKALFLAAVATTTLWSCGSDDNSSANKGITANGTEYILHTAKEGPKGQPGNYVSFEFAVRNDSTTVQDSRDAGGQTPMLQIKETPSAKPDPIEDLLQVMALGDSATLIQRMDTVPVADRHPFFKNSDNMYFDIVVTKIQTQEEFTAEQEAKKAEAEAAVAKVKTLVDETVTAYGAGELNDKITTTESGLKFMAVEEGTGAQAAAGKTVGVNYYGTLTDGTMFDNSFSRGQLFSFPLGQGRVIKGWDEGIALLKEGGKGFLFIPYELAYGEAGSPPRIPAKAELIFYVELEEVK